MSELLKIQDLSVEIMSTRGLVHAVRGVNLTVEPGSIHGIVGESGCGKSVTARSILRLYDKRYVRTRGHILFDGQDLMECSDKQMQKIRGKQISMIFQDPMTALNPLYKVGDQIAEVYIRHFGDSKQEARKKTLNMLELVGIHPAEVRYEQYPFEFSGGMLQRAVIAMAVAGGPKLIIADEPTTALDVTIQAQILELLQKLQRELNMAILVITHNFGIVSEICDTVSVMYAGTVLETGSKKDVFRNTANPYSRALMESIPRRGVKNQKLLTIPGIPPELFDEIEGCPFAPRCGRATERCHDVKPVLTPQLSTGILPHLAACHHAEGGTDNA